MKAMIFFVENSKEEFLNSGLIFHNWKGIFLSIKEEQLFSKIKQLSNNKTILNKSSFIIIIALVSLILFFYQNKSLNFSSLFIISLNFLGIFFSIPLILAKKGYPTNFIQKFCNTRDNQNCAQVFNSKVFPFYDYIDLAEIALIYFISTSVAFLFYTGINPDAKFFLLTPIIASSLLLLPITIFIQWKVIKAWCKICLMISTSLLIQAFFLLFELKTINISQYNFLKIYGNFSILFLLIAAIWLSIRSFIKYYFKYEWLEVEYEKFKKNPVVFHGVMMQQPFFGTPDTNAAIQLGNPNAKIRLQIISGPTCVPCAVTHETLKSLLKVYNEEISFEIFFIVDSFSGDNENFISAINLLSLANHSSFEKKEILDEWYQLKNINLFREKYLSEQSFEMAAEEFKPELIKVFEWCEMHKIDKTPTILINGALYSEYYSSDDLYIIIPMLIENLSLNDIRKTSLV